MIAVSFVGEETKETLHCICLCVRESLVKPAGPPDSHWELWDQTRLNFKMLDPVLDCTSVCLLHSVQNYQKKKKVNIFTSFFITGEKRRIHCNKRSKVQASACVEFPFLHQFSHIL